MDRALKMYYYLCLIVFFLKYYILYINYYCGGIINAYYDINFINLLISMINILYFSNHVKFKINKEFVIPYKNLELLNIKRVGGV